MASGGLETAPKFIDSVYDRKGNLLYKNQDLRCDNCEIEGTPFVKHLTSRIIPEDINYQMTSLLVGAMKRGTGARSNILNKTIAGKTGTTNNCFDTWFIGFTPYITAGLYVGYDIPKSMGNRESGATISLPIFIDFMKEAVRDIENVEFPVPDTIVLKKNSDDDSNSSRGAFEAFRKKRRSVTADDTDIDNQKGQSTLDDIIDSFEINED
jgi:penicillin-binding protein 1A